MGELLAQIAAQLVVVLLRELLARKDLEENVRHEITIAALEFAKDAEEYKVWALEHPGAATALSLRVGADRLSLPPDAPPA